MADVQTIADRGHDLGIDLAIVPLEFLPELLEEVEAFITEQEARIAPARAHAYDIRNEIERRLDAEQATMLKSGPFVMRFDRIAPKASVREAVLAEPGVIDELRSVLPLKVFEKAVSVKEVPARIEYRSNLTYLKKLLDAGEKAVALYNHLVDRGVERRRLVVEREQERVEPTPLQTVTP